MFFLKKPSPRNLEAHLDRFAAMPFSYPDVGATRGRLPDGYVVGRQRVLLGHGMATFERARANLQAWRMFPTDFVDLVWPIPFEPGRVVATLFRAPGFWTLNPCKIVCAFDETAAQGAYDRFGFSYGTLDAHLASGEERFSIDFCHKDESVWYDILCFSRAQHWVAKMAYPYLRIQQDRFRKLSAVAMQSASRGQGAAN